MNDSGFDAAWQVKPLHLEGLEAEYVVDGAGLTLGRDPSNQVVLGADRYPEVSKHHARLVVRDGGLVLEDLSSTNGTLIAGERVEHRRRMQHGEVFQLGAGGPRFAVVSSSRLNETAALDGAPLKRRMGTQTIRLVKEQLGIPEEAGVDQMLRRRSRVQVTTAVTLVLVLVAVFVVGFFVLSERGDEAVAALEKKVDAALLDAKESIDAQRQAWADQARDLQAARDQWEGQKRGLEAQRAELLADLKRLEADEKTAAGAIERLRTELDRTNQSLSSYNPVNLEAAKLREVSRVERSVVLIEARQTFQDQDSGKTLYLSLDTAGIPTPNFREEGRPFSREGTGSGFCVSSEGYLITNAHVVHKKDEPEFKLRGTDIELQPQLELEVTFSGNSDRHSAVLVDYVADDDQDLALLKITPFEGMPHLDSLDLAVATPSPGSEVFLLGFPLGKRAMQQGNTMIASTFKGILSRSVDTFLQVDAAVHPGNSGGPLIDGQGRVLGVVVGMQVVDEVAGSSSIGYVIPIVAAGSIWPPVDGSSPPPRVAE